MELSMINILIGIISGIVSGTGMGGGTILILLLSLFRGVEQHVSQAVNIVFFIPTSIAAIIVNIKHKAINWKIGITITIFGIIGSIAGAIISLKTEVDTLKKYFGIFLMIIAIVQIYSLIKEYIYKKNKHNNVKEEVKR